MKKIILYSFIVCLVLLIVGATIKINNNSLIIYGTDSTVVTGDLIATGEVTYDFPHVVAAKDSSPVYTTSSVAINVYTTVRPGLVAIETPDHVIFAGDSITIETGYDGDYLIDFEATIIGANTNDYKICVYKNNVLTGQCAKFSGLGSNNYVSFRWFWYLPNLVAGDDLSFKVVNKSASSNPITIYESKMRCEKKPE